MRDKPGLPSPCIMSAPTSSRPRGAVGRSGGRRRGRGLSVLRWLALAALLLTAVFYLGGGWYFSGQIRDGITAYTPVRDLDLRVTEVTPRSVTLEATAGEAPEALGADKVYGLEWDGGYGQVRALLGERQGEVIRSFVLLTGSAPQVGDLARLRKEAFPDPQVALDVPVEEVTFTSEDGVELPAWYAPGEGSTWAVLTHGKGVTRGEMLRLMRTTTDLGLPSLNITYRRDAENGGGLNRFGQDEWRDLEAAVEYARDRGATDIVLVGGSAGAGISASFLENSPLREHVAALVFDAPMLDLGAAVSHGASDRELPVVGLPIPDSLVWTARQIAGIRFDLDPEKTSYLDDTSWLTVPTWVHHGTTDATVPHSVTERLDAAEPELVAHTLVEGAEHVESWNVAPRDYDRSVRAFLSPYAP
jgi:uncharacterized protein